MAPIDRYHASAIDLDLEGQTLADTAADARRAQAIAAVQRQMAARHAPLAVWMTLPVSGVGLTAEGIAAVRSMLAAHVRLAGVNAMAMDFGPDEGAANDMVGTIERALYATHAQVQSLWRAAGLPSGAAAAWGHVGVTVMLGVNDISDQRLTTHDAHELAAFVNAHGIPRVSAWSLNRDSECGGAFPQTGVLSNTCSGVMQSSLQFTRIFGALKGTKTARPQSEANGNTSSCAASLYRLQPTIRPPAHTRSGDRPPPTATATRSSGRVRSIKRAGGPRAPRPAPRRPTRPTVPGSRSARCRPAAMRRSWCCSTSGRLARWSASAVYHQGDRVTFEGLPYRARWYTHGEQPLAELPANPSAPWEPLFKYPGEPAELRQRSEVPG